MPIDFERPELRRPFPIPGWWEPIIISLNCKTRVLIVSDGSPRFGTGGFGLSEAVDIIKAATTTDHPIEVTTAHTGTDADADVDNFTFNGSHTVNGSSRTLSHYEEIWMFGFASSNSGMTGAPLNAIIDFMDNGGGVFATGDHDNLGGAMCGEIPRVKSMRQWYTGIAPSGGGTGRIDTNVPSPGADPQFDLQSDNIPQRIYPTWYGSSADAVPHALLSFPGGAVTYLPDHPHEGRCVVPSPLNATEWPNDGGGTQIPPEVVAHGVSAGPGFSGSKPSITPPVLFGVIGAYDGHQTGVGRIVVDSTWHHWININLNGESAFALSGGVATDGLYEGGLPTEEYLQIQAYFQNIAGWLEPNRFRLCWLWLRLPILRWEWPIIQELDPPGFDDLDHILEIGKLVQTTITRHTGAATVSEVVGALVDGIDGFDPKVRPLVDRFARGKRPSTPVTFDDALLTHALLGGAMVAFARATPDTEDPTAMMKKLLGRKPSLDKVAALMSDGAAKGLALLSDDLGKAGRQLGSLRKVLPALAD